MGEVRRKAVRTLSTQIIFKTIESTKHKNGSRLDAACGSAGAKALYAKKGFLHTKIAAWMRQF